MLLQVIHQALHATEYGRALPRRTAEDTAEGRGARVRQDVFQENVRFEQEQPAPLDAGGVVYLRVVRLAFAAFLDGHATFEHAFLAAPVQRGAVHAAGTGAFADGFLDAGLELPRTLCLDKVSEGA